MICNEQVGIVPYRQDLSETKKLEIAREAKYQVDKWYAERFGANPLTFVAVLEQDQPNGTYNPLESNGFLVPSVQVWSPKRGSELDWLSYLTHEIAHIHNCISLNMATPKWVDEGLAPLVDLAVFEKQFIYMPNQGRKLYAKIRKADFLSAKVDPETILSCYSFERWMEVSDNPGKYGLKPGEIYGALYQIVSDMLKTGKFEGFVEEFQAEVSLLDYAKDITGLELIKEVKDPESIMANLKVPEIPGDPTVFDSYDQFLVKQGIDKTPQGLQELIIKHFGLEFMKKHSLKQ